MAKRSAPFVPNSARKIRANGERPVGSFTRGNSRSDSAFDNRKPLLEVDDYAFGAFGDPEYRPVAGRFGSGLATESAPIVYARKPYADTPSEPRLRAARKVYVCPGCGMTPPSGRTKSGALKCDNCW